MDPFLKENRVGLLTIPRSDLDLDNSSQSTTTERRQDAALLLQLPPGWKPSDLKGARFVAAADEQQQQQQAALVVEAKKCSFSCFTVETSNAFIMVPPPQNEDEDEDRAAGSFNSSRNKRSKVRDDGKILTTVPARLLKMGGSGASFLELRARVLRRADLQAALRDFVWDPYAAAAAATTADDDGSDKQQQQQQQQGIIGRTLQELAAALQVSTAQITKGLAQIPNALQLSRRTGGGGGAEDQQQYVLISEEPLQECYSAVVAALTEVDEFQDYAGADGIAVNRMIEEALYRMSNEERFADADRVIQHCLRQLSQGSSSSSSSRSTIINAEDKNARIRLDVGKVAVCVAHRLFQKGSSATAWIDETAFFDAWQSELPGVGPLYQVHPDMLLGLAVVVDKEDGLGMSNNNDDAAEGPQRQWKYLPAEKLSMDPKACFDELFAVKDRWLLRELEPYLQRLTDNTTAAELLLRFTKIETEERDGLSIKVYLKK